MDDAEREHFRRVLQAWEDYLPAAVRLFQWNFNTAGCQQRAEKGAVQPAACPSSAATVARR